MSDPEWMTPDLDPDLSYTVCEFPGCYEAVARIVCDEGAETGYCDFHANPLHRTEEFRLK